MCRSLCLLSVTLFLASRVGLIYGALDNCNTIRLPPPRSQHNIHKCDFFACGDGTLLLWQFIALLICGLWAGAWTYAIFKITSKFTAIRVSESGENIGLDLECHGEM